jgi:hypothetical protein
MPVGAMWWTRAARTRDAAARPGWNPLLLDDEDEEDGGLASPRTPPLHQPGAPHPPLPLRLRTLSAGFRLTNLCLALAAGAAVASAYALARAAAPIPPAPAIVALACVGAVSLLTGALAALTASATSPRGLSNYSAALGAIVLVELIGCAALWASGRARLPDGLPAGRAPATAAAVAGLQITGLALASLLGPAALRAAEDADAADAAAVEGWASPPRWGAASVGATPARPPAGVTSPPSSSTSPLATPPPAHDADGVAWRARMRDRYGLDTGAFGYDPAGRRAAWQAGGGGGGGGGGSQSRGEGGGEPARRCAVM